MQENIYAVVGADADALEQFLDSFRRDEPWEPEKALLQAVLADAVHCYRKYVGARDREGKEKFRETEQWIMRDGNGWIFSFDNVCDYLALDPDYVRRKLRESPLAPAQPLVKKRRRSSRRQAA